MVRASVIVFAVLVTLPVLLSPAVPAGAVEQADDVYVVQSGDTLSKIAGKLLGDPKLWPELLEANPQVTDPEKIYPGDSLAIPLPDAGDVEAVAISEGTEELPSEPYEPLPVEPPEEEIAAPQEPPIPDLPVELVKPEATISQQMYRASGYIATDLPETTVVAAVPETIGFIEGDEIFIGMSAEEGTTFTVVRPTQEVHHPRSGEFLGWVIKIVGWAEVTCRGDETSRALLTSTVDSVNIGDLVVPFDPEDILEDNRLGDKVTDFCLKEGEDGFIVASRLDRTVLGEGDIVYLNRGNHQGVETGDQFVVYRTIDPGEIQVIGQVQVIRVGDNTSTALVINSSEEISVSDPVQSWEPPMEETASGG